MPTASSCLLDVKFMLVECATGKGIDVRCGCLRPRPGVGSDVRLAYGVNDLSGAGGATVLGLVESVEAPSLRVRARYGHSILTSAWSVASHTGRHWRIPGESTCPELYRTALKCFGCNGSDVVIL